MLLLFQLLKRNMQHYMVLSMLILSVVYLIFPGRGIAATKQELNSQLQQLQGQINQFQDQIEATQAQSRTLQTEIAQFDTQIASLNLQIQANKTKIQETNLQINELQDQIIKREAELKNNREVLSELLVEMYKLGDTSLIYVGLGNENLSEFLDKIKYSESVQEKVTTIIGNIKNIKASLEEQQKTLVAERIKLQNLAEELDEQQAAIALQQQQKEALLAQTQNNEQNFQNLLNQNQSQARQITKELEELSRKSAPSRNMAGSLIARGELGYPLMNPRMTQGYGSTSFSANSPWYSFHNGVDFGAPFGTQLFAAADGVISHCARTGVAYGNWCTIKHTIKVNGSNKCVLTLYGHMQSFRVAPGQTVKQGDLIGFVGSTGYSTGPHLHFTVFDCNGYGVGGSSNQPYGPTFNPLGLLD